MRIRGGRGEDEPVFEQLERLKVTLSIFRFASVKVIGNDTYFFVIITIKKTFGFIFQIKLNEDIAI